jgi:hypothetical protein
MLCLCALGQAPMQCGGGDPEGPLRTEESPAEALYGLAQKFKAQGDQGAYRKTLHYLVDRYPNSRFAERARQDLAGQDAGDGS